MKAYVVVQETVKNEEMFAAYRKGVIATLKSWRPPHRARRPAYRGRRRVAASSIGGYRIPFEGSGRRVVPFPRLPGAAALAAQQLGRRPSSSSTGRPELMRAPSFAPTPSPAPTTPISPRPLAGRPAAGLSVTVSDLYQMGFDPCERTSTARTGRSDTIRRAEQADARVATSPGARDVAAEIARLDQADLLILQYPMWWHLPPAMLEGWFDGCSSTATSTRARSASSTGASPARRAMVSVTVGTSEAT